MEDEKIKLCPWEITWFSRFRCSMNYIYTEVSATGFFRDLEIRLSKKDYDKYSSKLARLFYED